MDEALLQNLTSADVPGVVSNVPDEPVIPGIVTEHATGWMGLPGLIGHRGGRSWSTLFAVTDVAAAGGADGTQQVIVSARDDDAGLSMTITIELTPHGLVRAQRHSVRSAHRPERPPRSPTPSTVSPVAFPVPGRAAELLDFAGRHLRERHPQRRPFDIGSLVRDNRRGRTGLDGTMLLAAGTQGFDFGAGEVWALHTAWSGNHRSIAERTPNGHAVLAGGELLLPGEITLTAAAAYTTPWIYGVVRPRPGRDVCPVSPVSCGIGPATRARPGRSS